MKKKSGIIIYAFAIFGLLLMITYGCKSKDENSNPNLPLTVTDIDGNVYNTIAIGNQVWMTENLKTTKFNDGSSIPLITDNTVWNYLSSPGYCFNNNDSVINKNVYGALYNWYSVNTGKLAPIGWRIPTKDDWNALIFSLGGDSIAGGKLKETAQLHWQIPNVGATNEIGFTALPGGIRGNAGSFINTGYLCFWWSNTLSGTSDALSFTVNNSKVSIDMNGHNKGNGFSIRCIKK